MAELEVQMKERIPYRWLLEREKAARLEEWEVKLEKIVSFSDGDSRQGTLTITLAPEEGEEGLTETQGGGVQRGEYSEEWSNAPNARGSEDAGGSREHHKKVDRQRATACIQVWDEERQEVQGSGHREVSQRAQAGRIACPDSREATWVASG